MKFSKQGNQNMFILWAVGILFLAITVLVGPLLVSLLSKYMPSRKLDADYRRKADPEFYEYANTTPFTNDIYVRQLRKFNLVSPMMTHEKFEYIGKKAVNGIQLGAVNYSRRTPFRTKKVSDAERVVKIADDVDDSIEEEMEPVYSIQKDDPLLDLPSGESGVKKGDMVLT